MNNTESEIQKAIDTWTRALCARDVAGMMADYDKSVVLFDVKPPFQTKGPDAVRRMWEECLPCFPEKFEIERRDLRIITGGDVAVAHWIFHLVGWPEGHPAAGSWMRATVTFQRQAGRWAVVHEHVSVPFNPMNGMAVFTPES